MMNNTKNIVIVVLILLLGICYLSKDSEKTVDKEEKEIIPGSSGTTEKIVIKDSIVYVEVPVPYPVPGKEKIVVDGKYKDLYDNALKENDSLKTYALYLEAITINEFKGKVISNDTIDVNLYTQHRGELLAYQVDYTIKERVFKYEPKTNIERPKLTLLLGVESGIPYKSNEGFKAKADVGIQTKNGDLFSIGPDTGGYIWLGYKKAFTIIK